MDDATPTGSLALPPQHKASFIGQTPEEGVEQAPVFGAGLQQGQGGRSLFGGTPSAAPMVGYVQFFGSKLLAWRHSVRCAFCSVR